MSAVSQTREDREESDAEIAETVADPMRPTLSGTRIVIGTTVATGAALIAVFAGLPVIAATALGAVIGGGAVATMSALRAPMRRYH